MEREREFSLEEMMEMKGITEKEKEIEEMLERAKRTKKEVRRKVRLPGEKKPREMVEIIKEPQEIITELPTGKIKEIVRYKTLAPEFRKLVTEKLSFIDKKGPELSFYKFVPRRIYPIRSLYNAGKIERIENWEKLESQFDFTPYYDEKQERWEGVIEYGDLSKPENMLSFLHEIGHSKSLYDPKRKKIEKEIVELEDYFEEYNKKIRKERRGPAENEVKGKIYEKKRKLIVPLDDYIKYLRIKAEDERFAWATALKTLRLAQEKNINLGIAREDVDKIIHGLDNLGGYERDWIENADDPRISEDLKGIFSKKYYDLKREREI